MTQQRAVIFGGGKIARGFIAHLLTLSGADVTFVEAQPAVVQALQERGRYTVHIFGRPDKSAVITDYHVLPAQDAERVAAALAAATIAFTAVGGKNLPALAPLIAAGVRARREAGAGPLNLITCENWYRPANALRAAVQSLLTGEDHGENRSHDGAAFDQQWGIAEATVLRSVIEPTPEQMAADPLAVQAQDYWTLQVDADRLLPPVPSIEGIQPVTNFYGALERKLFTYNAVNATISYLGLRKGLRFLHEAATDPQILDVAHGVLAETSSAICKQHGYSPEEQAEFAAGALRKFQNAAIQDPLERQVRDPLRKLGRHDRLVGAASLVLETGGTPRHLALAIAAALEYANPADPAAITLQQLRAELPLRDLLVKVADLEPDSPLVDLVREAQPRLAEFHA